MYLHCYDENDTVWEGILSRFAAKRASLALFLHLFHEHVDFFLVEPLVDMYFPGIGGHDVRFHRHDEVFLAEGALGDEDFAYEALRVVALHYEGFVELLAGDDAVFNEEFANTKYSFHKARPVPSMVSHPAV